jgi:mono/diheme cytochrome c family protein
MKKAVRRVLVLIGALVVLGAFLVVVVAPQLNWSASARPSMPERRLAQLVLGRWIRHSAPAKNNPMQPSADNLKDGQHEYGEHCAVCHGVDGSGRNLLGADFYPPIPRLDRGLPGLSDAQIFFIIANGIRYTAMPGFGAHHDADDIWRIILWIQHFPNLTPQQRAELKQPSGFMEHQDHDEGAEHAR